MREPSNGRTRAARVHSWPLVATLMLICLNLEPPGAYSARQHKLGVSVWANQSEEVAEMRGLETPGSATRSANGQPVDILPWLGVGWMPRGAPNMLPQFTRFVGFITRLNQINFIAHFFTCANPTSAYSRWCVPKGDSAQEQYTLNPPNELNVTEWPRMNSKRLYGCNMLNPYELSANFAIYELTFEFPIAAKKHLEKEGALPKVLRPPLARTRGPFTDCQVFSYSGTEQRTFSYFEVKIIPNSCRNNLCEFRSLNPPDKSGSKPGRVCSNHADLGAPIICTMESGKRVLAYLVAKLYEKKKVCSMTFDAYFLGNHYNIFTRYLDKDLTYDLEPTRMPEPPFAKKLSFRRGEPTLPECPTGPLTATYDFE